MDKVEQIFAIFFDANKFHLKNVIIALVIFAVFLILKGIFSELIIKLFNMKEKNYARYNTFYKPLKLFFLISGIVLAIMSLGPTDTFKAIVLKCYRLFIIILATYSIANLVSPDSKFERLLRKKMTKANDAMVRTICRSIKILIYFIGFVIVTSELGYNISGLIAGLGIGGVALALAAQDTAKNIIGAAMIILDKPFSIGDWIRIGDNEGSVEEITFRSTRIREIENTLVSIPNSTVVNSNIINWSRLKKRRIQMNLTLEFETPLKTVADVQNDLIILLQSEKNIIPSSIYVKFNEIASNGYNLKLFCYTPIVNYIDYLAYLDLLNFKIMEIFQNNKANLAFDSQTIYLRNS